MICKYRIFILLTFFLFIENTIKSQYLDDYGIVLNERILDELKEFQDARTDQIAHADEIARKLHREINLHPVLQENRELKTKALFTLSQLMKRSGDFGFLRRVSGLSPLEKQKISDTISKETMLLELKIQSLNDSLYILYNNLIDITQRGNEETRATKERAALLIGKSPFYEHIEYIFENHKNMYFGFVLDPYGDMDTDFGVYRSGMMGLITDLNKDDIMFYSWRLMPFLLNYWGNSQWAANLHPDFEFLLFTNLTHNFNQRNLLLEFMRANAEDPDTPIFKMLERRY